MTRFLHFFSCIVLFCGSILAQDSPLKILEQPEPNLPSGYGTLDAEGTIVLKVEFLGNGLIGKVVPISRMPVENLTELAIEAARKIRFEPEVKSGTSVDAYALLRYGYSPNGFWKILKPIQRTNRQINGDPQAEAVLEKAVETLGGERYLGAKTQIGRGKFSIMKDGAIISFQTFLDVIVFPDKERTEFKGRGIRQVQTNNGKTGWVFDGDTEQIKDQTDKQLENFKRGIRTSLDNLLRGHWKGQATLSYIGKRPASLGKRNDVVKLTYDDGLAVEFEFAADDGTPAKAMYKTQNAEEIVAEEDRYAQFVDVGGIRTPFIIDRFTNGKPSSRINYESVEFNAIVPDSVFSKPSGPKELKKDMKL
ncbi:MAG: hypothetical protein WBD22_09715 [Pyrinomonadaceae bacterium]